MNRTKKIYFLAAFVMIIGCYALNKSYSLFVATEEQEAVTSKVPILESSISMPTITLSSNEECLIKQTINNTSEVPINYSLSSTGTNYEIKLVDDTNNTALGSLESSSTKDIYLYLKNTSSNENTITFNINKKYTTLNNDLTTNITNTYTVKSYANPYAYNTELLSYNIINNYITSDNYTGTVPEDKIYTLNETKKLFGNNVKLSLPIKSTIVLSLPSPPTNPGKEISTENENVLAQTQDDYGTSYYYRGNVTNNFVTYANMCFRIVRIEGDGSIKMILASEKTCSETNVTSSSGIASSAIYGYNNYGRKRNDYLNSAEDNARTKLNSWIEEKITNNTNVTDYSKALLKTDNWCIGDRTSAYNGSTLKTESADELLNTRTNFQYSGYKRAEVETTPSLMCDGSKEKSGEIDENIVGMLTTDEVIFAGATTATNSTYYLNKNAGTYWWTLSLRDSRNGYDTVYGINGNGALSGDEVYQTYSGVRPTITIIASAEISSGDGSITNAYIIKES